MNTFLLDTGPIVGYLDRSDAAHGMVGSRMENLKAHLITTGPVITEAMFFVQGIPGGPEALIAFIEQASVAIMDAFSQPDLDEAARLMRQYADTPMDFADASLVVVAQKLGIDGILTLDEREFRTYRFSRRKSFRLILQDA